jgi:hypothetical protein
MKRKVISFFVLFLSFVAIILVIQIANFGTILGYTIGTDFFDVNAKYFVFGLSFMFVVGLFYFMVKTKVSYFRARQNIKKNISGGYIRLRD